jgi:exodeoxyribonuclease V alpha subunit
VPVDVTRRATGIIRDFHEAGVLDWSDVHVAQRLAELTGETRQEVVLAAALAVGAVRSGSVCVDLSSVSTQTFEQAEVKAETTGLPWPDVSRWLAALTSSPLVGMEPDAPQRPLRLDDSLLYLDRYWRYEQSVRSSLSRRLAEPPPPVFPDLDSHLERLFPGEPGSPQRLACRAAATSWVSVIAGGPGTGKTTTIGRLLVLLHELGVTRVALAAPTGKAAVRMGEAIAADLRAWGASGPAEGLTPVTLHRLLGLRPGPGGRRHADDRLNHDVVIVDEMSMVSLPTMAELLRAARLGTRIVLVGDPHQLSSVDAGAVLADLTDGPASRDLDVVTLTRNYRFGSKIARLADAIRSGDSDAALTALEDGDDAVRFHETDLATVPGALRESVTSLGARMVEAAVAGDHLTALDILSQHQVLCGHRRGPFGVAAWNQLAHQWIGHEQPSFAGSSPWREGRPVFVTRNAAEIGLYNGDTGVVVATPSGPAIAFPGGRTVQAHLLDEVATAHAMTIHKAQGSQFRSVSLIVPPPGSPLLTRQLLYTAVTRAQERLVVYGTKDALVEAIEHPAHRASGLRRGL